MCTMYLNRSRPLNVSWDHLGFDGLNGGRGRQSQDFVSQFPSDFLLTNPILAKVLHPLAHSRSFNIEFFAFRCLLLVGKFVLTL